MSRPDANFGRPRVDFEGLKDAANKHGGDRRALRKAARYAGMGQPINLAAGQGFLPESVGGIAIDQPQNEGQSKI